MNKTPVSELSPLHQELIRSWQASKEPSEKAKALSQAEQEQEKLERAIANCLYYYPATHSELILKFGANGNVGKAMRAIAQLKQKGVIEPRGSLLRLKRVS